MVKVKEKVKVKPRPKSHLQQGRVLGPLLQPLVHGGPELLHGGQAGPGLAHVGLLVEVVGPVRLHRQPARTLGAQHRVLQHRAQDQLTAGDLLVHLRVWIGYDRSTDQETLVCTASELTMGLVTPHGSRDLGY